MNSLMKAMVVPNYGSLDLLQLREVARPTPKDNEVLIRVRASTLTAADSAFRKGEPFVARLYAGLRRPKFPVLGSSLAGQIEAVGKDVELFTEGDPVFGMSNDSFGAHAEYKCLPQDGLLAAKPESMSYEEAAVILEATTALSFLKDVAAVQNGQSVLINGASGSVGYFGVQLAKHFGASVTAVSSSAKLDLVKALGADEVIDYTQTDFAENGQRYDVIFDAAGKSSFSRAKESLTDKGVYVSTAPTPATLLQMLWTARRRGKKAKFAATGLMQNTDNLALLGQLFESGQIRPVIDKRYPLADTAEAYRYIEAGHKRGSVVITV